MRNTTAAPVERERRAITAGQLEASPSESGQAPRREPAVTADFVCWCRTRRRVYGTMWRTRR